MQKERDSFSTGVPTVATAVAPPVHQGPRESPEVRERAGALLGINTAPGSEDDNWIVPPAVDLADGTRVQLYKDGEALFAAFEAIKHAKRRICLESYIFASDDTGCAFADLLSKKSRDGVPTFVIYDSFGSCDISQLWREKPKMFANMRRAGVRMREFNPIRPWECNFSWRPLNRDHRKLLVVDDHIAGLGGLNVGREYAGSWVIPSKDKEDRPWRDSAIGVVGPGATHLFRAFSASWKYCSHGGRVRRAAYLHGVHHQAFGLLASAPTANSPLRPFLAKLLRDATKSIELTMAYFAPDDTLIDELVRAARRGVHVRLMLPAMSDVKLLLIAAHSFYECLMDAGVEIFERQGVILHAKTICVDRRVSVIGSTNLDTRSIEYNCEISAIVRDETFGEQVHGLFENDVTYANKIDPTQWRARPRLDRLVQWTVSRARYLL